MNLFGCYVGRYFYNKNIIKFLLLYLVIGANVSLAAKVDESVDLSAAYSIVVASSNNKFTKEDLSNVTGERGYRYYVVKSKNKYQLRYGFFKSKKAAIVHQKKLKSVFKKTYVVRTSREERELSSKTAIESKAHVNLAEYLIYSSAYKAANVLAAVTGDAIEKVRQPVREKIPVKAPSTEVEQQYDSYLVINLKTTNSLSDFEKTIEHPQIAGNAFYISELKIDGRSWYQYRLGFFVSSTEARIKLEELIKEYPLARIIRVTKEEKIDAVARVRKFFSVVASGESEKAESKLAVAPINEMKDLMKRGSRQLSDKRYKSSIKTFVQLLRYPENKYSMDAQEFLGFAYELNKQPALARKEYSRYLSLYPESSGANRVRQRLASLLTARVDPRKKLRENRRRIKNAQWEYFSSFSQFYREDRSRLNEDDLRENLSLLSSDISVSSRYRGEEYLMNSRFIGGHDVDFTNDKRENSGSINSLYFNVTDLKNGLYGSIGRQNISKDGVLGRMDGIQLSYTFNDYLKLNTVFGYVVEDTEKTANSDKFFSGISADLGTFFNAWDFNVYYIKQSDGDIVGREAIGSEMRYFHPMRTLFTLIDYDIMFKELNTLLMIGSWQFENKVQMNATVDIRKSPFLTASNALLGNTTQFTVNELLLSGETQESIIALAKEQTAASKSFLLGVNSPIDDKFQISADVTLSKLSSSTVGGLPVEGTDNEYFYNTQLIGNSLMMDNDSTIFGYRFSDTDRGKVNSLSVNMRLPVTREWRLNPRIRFDKRKNVDGTDQSINAIALRVDYRFKRNVNFELDLGQEQTDQGTLDDTTDKTKSFFLSAGYRYDF